MARFSRVQTIEHEIGEDGTVSLRVTNPDVQIRATPGSTARLRGHFDISAGSDEEADEVFDRVALQVETGRGRLAASEPRTASVGIVGLGRLFGLGSGRTSLQVEVEIPAGTKLIYQGVSGDVTITGLRGTQRYRTISGDLSLTDVSGAIELNAVSGDTSLRSEGVVELEAKSVSGDVWAIAPRFESLRAVTVSGDLEIEGALGSGAAHRMETVSGDLRLAPVNGLVLEVRGLSTDVTSVLPHRREGSRERRRYIVGDGGPEVYFNSMSGDVRIEPPRRLTPGDLAPPTAPPAPRPPAPPLDPERQMEILRAVERGEMEVDEAARLLAEGGTDA